MPWTTEPYEDGKPMTVAAAMDRQFFEDNPKRRRRLRWAVDGELPGVPPKPVWMAGRLATLVTQLAPGARTRRHIWLHPDSRPEASDDAACERAEAGMNAATEPGQTRAFMF